MFLHVKDINLVQMLEFYGYWDNFGYSKHVDFASTFRIELVSKTEPNGNKNFFVQFTYDDEKIKFPWCSNIDDSDSYLCPMDDFI